MRQERRRGLHIRKFATDRRGVLFGQGGLCSGFELGCAGIPSARYDQQEIGAERADPFGNFRLRTRPYR